MEPEEGSRRLIVGEVLHCLDDMPSRRGLLVQEYEGGRWLTVCPLTDVNFMLDAMAPRAWIAASHVLRARMERGENIALADERAALVRAAEQEMKLRLARTGAAS
jgi:hypothetical protein